MIDPQYIEGIIKGSTVSYGKTDVRKYKVQDDGKGYLHIIVFEDGKRKKIGIDKLHFFEYGTEADWVFNEWWKIYPDYEVFKQFANNEKLAA